MANAVGYNKWALLSNLTIYNKANTMKYHAVLGVIRSDFLAVNGPVFGEPRRT